MTGRFVWHDLFATDPSGAIAFYTEVIGWKTELFGENPESREPGHYTVWVSSQGPIGGVLRLPDVATELGTPPHWKGYVEVDELEATLARASELGGSVLMPPTEIPNVGRFGVIADPQGAALFVAQWDPAEQPASPPDKSRHGQVTWNELHARDPREAFAFYRDLFGWTLKDELDMGPAGKYLIYGKGDDSYGGIMTRTPDMPSPPSWIYYIQVDDLDGAMARAARKGARTIYGPSEVPGGGRIAHLADPQGALFALHGAA